MTETNADSYIAMRNATMEMRRSLRRRQDGCVTVDGCIISWDTKERRVTLDGGAPKIILDAVKDVVNDVQFVIE